METLQQSIEGMHKNPFMLYNHIEIGAVERDHAETRLVLQPDSLNTFGRVHGGAFFTMADVCAGMTARSDGRRYVTQDASVNFIRNVTGGTLTCRGTVLNRGRKVCLVETRVTDDTGRLLFSGVFTMYCVSED